MSDWLVLGLLAIGFYFYECCTWTPAAAFACFKRPFRLSWTAAAGAELIGNESGGFAFSDPLTLSGNVIQCSSWPIAVSPDGVCLDSADATTFWAFDDIASISSFERTVKFNGQVAFTAASESLARQLAAHLDAFRQMPIARRPAAIRTAVSGSFDVDLLDEAWSRFNKASRALTTLAALPLVWLAVVTPVALWLFGPLHSWPYLLVGLFLTSLAVVVEFVRVHRAQLPGASDRWIHAVSMALFPIAAIRAADRISRECAAHFHPAAVAGLFCSDRDDDAILRRLGFDLNLALADHDGIGKCRAWFRAEQRRAFTRLLQSLKRDPFAEPEPIDDAMIAYCPRCHGQFGEGGECADCGEVPLIAFGQGKTRQHA